MQNSSLWQAVLGEIELTIDPTTFKTWFEETDILDSSSDEITIEVKNVFAVTQFEKKYNDMVRSTLEKQGATPSKIKYVQKQTSKKRTINRETSLELPTHNHDSGSLSLQQSRTSPTAVSQLNPKYSFDNFIMGSSNAFAYNAAQAIVANPGTRFNPLFVYGGVGLGKTHLAQAIGNEVLARNPKMKIVYTSFNDFTREFLDSIRHKKKFPEYREADVLIVDDMQFVSGKEKTQEEFFNIFNSLHEKNKQIILTSDRPPASIATLTDRLRSRFEMGMVVDVQLPDLETRYAIIETKAAISGHELDRDTVEYLASTVKTNIRELEGSLNQLLAYAEMRGVAPDKNLAEGLIGNSARQTRPKHITSKQIIDKTAKFFSLSSSEVCSAKRDKHIANARQIAMYLLRNELHLSFPKIAGELGRKDHTTAMHSINKVEQSLKLDMLLREQVEAIREGLYA